MKKIEFWLATVLSGILTVILDKIFSPKVPWDKIADSIFSFLVYRIQLYQLLFFTIIFALCYLLFRTFFTANDSIYSKKQQQLIKQCHQINISLILWQYDVRFDDNDKPYIDNLAPYCTKHGTTPMKMHLEHYGREYTCVINGCQNQISLTDKSRIATYILSKVEQRWKDIQ